MDYYTVSRRMRTHKKHWKHPLKSSHDPPRSSVPTFSCWVDDSLRVQGVILHFTTGLFSSGDCFSQGLFWSGLFFLGLFFPGTVFFWDCFFLGLFWSGLFFLGLFFPGTVFFWDCFFWDCFGRDCFFLGLFFSGTVLVRTVLVRTLSWGTHFSRTLLMTSQWFLIEKCSVMCGKLSSAFLFFQVFIWRTTTLRPLLNIKVATYAGFYFQW